MQAIKLFEQNKLSASFFARRMLVLFIIGVLHILLLWSGDVVHLYAILGLLTTLLIKRSNKLILVLAVFFLLFPFYDQLVEYFFRLIHFHPETYLSEYTGETANQVIKNGGYLEGLKLRTLEYLSNTPMLFGFLAPIALSMFLFGLYLGKNKIHESLESFIYRIRKPAIVIAILTNVYRVLFLFVLTKTEIYRTEEIRMLFIKLMVISDVAMGLFYLWGIGWLWYRTGFRRILIPLKYIGRMALTNYILQSFIGLLLFSSLGFKLYETMSPSQTLMVACAVFVVQIVLSKIWLTYFRFGLLEWIWRCLTYRKLLPIRKQT